MGAKRGAVEVAFDFGGWPTFAGTITTEAAPPFAVFERWAAMQPAAKDFDSSAVRPHRVRNREGPTMFIRHSAAAHPRDKTRG